jgi:hypothetical protein
MRRLLVSVAFLAALLVVPSAALATTPPNVTAPQSPFGTTTGTVELHWDPVVLITYRVLRSLTPVTGVCDPAAPGDATEVMPATVGASTFTDDLTSVGQNRYCYWVEANDLISSAADSSPVLVTYDSVAPGTPAVVQSNDNGCGAPWTIQSASATDNVGPLTYTANGNSLPYQPGTGPPFEGINVTVTATDAAGNATSFVVSGHTLDSTRPPAPVLEVTTDPAQQKATLTWDNTAPDDGAEIQEYRVRERGPQGLVTSSLLHSINSLAFPNLQVDATYEFTLDAHDVCGFGSTSVRLVRLNDTTPPSTPIVAQPAYSPASRAVSLSWVPSTDNIQIDHYQVIRNGIPLAATDANVFTDTAPPQASTQNYVVRAVDTNGNIADSDGKSAKIPDWTPPTAPIAGVKANGTTVTVTWSAAADNVGVVGYDVLRDGRAVASMTGAVRTYVDRNVPVGPHMWVVRARDDAGNGADATGQSLIVRKPHVTATVVALKMAGALRGGAARYAIKGPARLLLDVRIVGTLKKAQLRVYVQSGEGRITVWRGTPGSSSPRERLHSALARHGWVTIKLGRTLHTGRTRLVLIASNRMVIVGKGKHKPSMRAG